MYTKEDFYKAVQKEEVIILASAGGGRVSMRMISPVLYDGAVLMFTRSDSKKYSQLKEMPCCAFMIGTVFVEARAEFLGATMLDENAALRKAYAEKYADAFDEGVENGGRESEFLLLRPLHITGWELNNGVPGGPIDVAF